MTETGYVISAGEDIPEDVTEVKDVVGDTWKLEGSNGWYCHSSWGGPPPNTEDGYFRDPARLVAAWFPLTVTAVREQPAEPEVEHCGNVNYVHEQHESLTLTEGGQVAKRLCPGTPPTPRLVAAVLDTLKPESVSGLCEVGEDRVTCIVSAPEHRRVYHDGRPVGDVAQTVLAESVDLLDLVRQYADTCAEDRVFGGVGDQLRSLFARIEAEVNRLRAERSSRLNPLEYDALEARAADEWHLMQALGVEELAEVMPAIERLKAAAAPASDPLALSLPSVPDGAIALVHTEGDGDKVWFDKAPGGGFGWVRRGDIAAKLWQLGDILDYYGDLTPVMREPRTWPKLDGPPEDLRKIELRKPDGMQTVVVRRKDDRWAAEWTGSNPEEFEVHETYSWTELLGEGDVTEVFDEDGTR